jgi:hypothetical protein
VGVEAAALAVGERKTFEKVLDFNTNSVRANPDANTLQESIEQVDRMIENSRLTGKNKTKFKKEALDALHAAQADGIISPERIKSAEDAEQALVRIKSDEFKKTLDKKIYDNVLGRAQTLVKQYRNEEEVAAAEDMRTRLREEASGLVALNGKEVSNEEISGITNTKLRNKVQDIANDARRMGKFNRMLGQASLAEIPAIQAKLTKALGTGGDQDFEFAQQRMLTATLNKLQAEANEEDLKLIAPLKEQIEAISAGVETAEIPQAIIDKIHNPETRANAQRLKDIADSVRDVRAFAKVASKKELAAELEALSDAFANSGGDQGKFFAARADLKAFAAALKIREAAIDKDPAKYAADTNQSVRSAIAIYSEDATPENFDAMADALVAAQVSMGIDRRDAHLLPSDLVSQFKSEKSRVISEPNAPNQIYELIVRERNRAGKHWPQIMKQMRKADAFSSTELIVAGMTRPDQIAAAQDLLIAAGLDKEKAFKGLPSGTKSNVGAAVIKETLALSATLSRGIAGGEVALRETQQAVQTLSMMYVSQGDTPESAAKRAAKVVVMDNYDFSDTFRVPVSANLPADTAENATQGVLVSMDFKDIAIPRGFASIEDNRRQYADAIKNNGYWSTNGDETGLILMAPNGVIVERVNGQVVELLWDQMRGAAPPMTLGMGGA